MPQKTISNPGGLYGLTADASNQVTSIFANASGGTLVEGDVVVCTDVAAATATTTTSANAVNVVGVVGPGSYPAGATMPVITQGAARVNIAANTVAANSVLTSAAAAKTAATVAAAVGQIGAVLGVSLESQAAKDANNTIRCFIKLG